MPSIEAVDFFYLAMPEVTDEADGSQDALLVRVAAGGHVGWGECEAAPLPSIAAFVCPMSHGVCRPVADSVLGQTAGRARRTSRRIAAAVAYNSMDLLQAAHTFSGVEMALWDILGKMRGEPVWQLLGYGRALPRRPMPPCSSATRRRRRCERAPRRQRNGFRAAKFGWGPIGRGSVEADAEHFVAAREGLGEDGILLVDAGQIFVEDVERRGGAPARAGEGPRRSGSRSRSTPARWRPTARSRKRSRQGASSPAAKAAHNVSMARHLIDYGGVGYIQIDCGRIGGIGPAKRSPTTRSRAA